MIRKILIANRGEIAVRVIRTCREMGIKTVCIYSEPDASSIHVSMADEAFCVGPAESKESYLNIPKILTAVKKSGADAVHPGYGFLSENPKFARALEAIHVQLLGPPASAMDAMASKTAARKIMMEAGVPVVPGCALSDSVFPAAAKIHPCDDLGYPIMLKAAYGGGGKGMRLVRDPRELKSELDLARSESRDSFGSDEIYAEKFLEKPRHIEVQLLVDGAGNVLTFPERECSVQRRHQKVIEESPSPFVDPPMRGEMCRIAADAARAVGYVGAGTVEFLADKDKSFYFMEMNTRLQVEHPITEMICGIDLVREQIEIAQGKTYPDQFRIAEHRGWSMEARICAEDPANNFMPMPGTIQYYGAPDGPFVRVDSAIQSGSVVGMDYDPMLAKIIAWDSDRDGVIRRLNRALGELKTMGITTNTKFIQTILGNSEFASGTYDTGLIGRMKPSPNSCDTATNLEIALTVLKTHLSQRNNGTILVSNMSSSMSQWQRKTLHRQIPGSSA